MKRKAEPGTAGVKNATLHPGVPATRPVHSSCEIPAWEHMSCKQPNDPDKILTPSGSLAAIVDHGFRGKCVY